MPAPLNVDREAVRVLVVALGVRQAAREMGLSEDTVSAWSARGEWLKKDAEMRELGLTRVREREEAAGRVQAIASKSPSDALADVLSDLSQRSKLGFLKASARVAEHLAREEDADALLARAKSASGWAKTAALAGGWAGAASTTVQVSVGLRLEMD